MHIARILPVAGVAVALVATAAGCGNSTSAKAPAAKPTATSGPVRASVDEWSVKAPAAASAGSITFNVKNTGKVEHEFVVLKTDKPADGLGNGARVSESGNAGEVEDLAPGASGSATLKLPAGHYALICNLPGHYKSGMHADFTVH